MPRYPELKRKLDTETTDSEVIILDLCGSYGEGPIRPKANNVIRNRNHNLKATDTPLSKRPKNNYINLSSSENTRTFSRT